MADTQESVAGQKTSANVDQSGGLLSSLMGETSVTQRWVVSDVITRQYDGETSCVTQRWVVSDVITRQCDG